MLYATGLTEDDMSKPQVGICSVWFEGNPCNMHLLDLSEHVKTGVVASDCVGYRFNTIGVSDGISMGTTGMRFSLQSRDLIADSIETTMGAQWYDGLVALPGCDKNMPGTVIAMGRLNRPAIMVYGGTIRAGTMPANGDPLDIVSAFQSYGEYVYDKIDEEERLQIVQHSCPGQGACGGMYTANTMATAIEALGKDMLILLLSFVMMIMFGSDTESSYRIRMIVLFSLSLSLSHTHKHIGYPSSFTNRSDTTVFIEFSGRLERKD